MKAGSQRGYYGHCINLPQDVEELADPLPRYPKDTSVIIVRMNRKNDTFKDVLVRRQKVLNALRWLILNRQKVLNALRWLILNNPVYKMVNINMHNKQLPENGVPSDLAPGITDSDTTIDHGIDFGPFISENNDETVYTNEIDTSSFLPFPENQQQEIHGIQEYLSQQAKDWPTIDEQPLSEFTTPFLAIMAFPTLFPDGTGESTNCSAHRDVAFDEKVKHVTKFSERKDDSTWICRFAGHPRFSYWALDLIQRRRTLDQSSIYLKQNPGDAHLTTDELREMAFTNNSSVLLSRISRYVGNIPGTAAYWHKVKDGNYNTCWATYFLFYLLSC